MKKLYFFLLTLFLSCPAHREIVAPVLQDYDLLYPSEAKNKGYEGLVLVKVLVNEDGSVGEVRLGRTSGIALLDSAALQTAQNFIFSPALVDKKPIPLWATIPVEFKLEVTRMDLVLWLDEVIILQRDIEKSYQNEKITELYKLYLDFVYSTRTHFSLDVNNYIREAILDKTASSWEDFWTVYPAQSLLFIDILYRYPDAAIRLNVEQDFNEFLKEETIRIRNTMMQPRADTLISRLQAALKD
jgi:TonB family protein